MYLLTTMREGSSRCPGKMVRPLCGNRTLAHVALDKIKKLASDFSGYGVAIHPKDARLVDIARRSGVGIVARSDESITGAPPINVIFSCLKDVEDEYVLWMNPSLPFFPVDHIRMAARSFVSGLTRSMTPVRERKNWFWSIRGGPLNNVDPTQVTTQGSEVVYESIHAFHIFDRKRLLEKAVYWEFGCLDPELYIVDGPDRWFMDVDTEHDFSVLAGYIANTKIEV